MPNAKATGPMAISEMQTEVIGSTDHSVYAERAIAGIANNQAGL